MTTAFVDKLQQLCCLCAGSETTASDARSQPLSRIESGGSVQLLCRPPTPPPFLRRLKMSESAFNQFDFPLKVNKKGCTNKPKSHKLGVLLTLAIVLLCPKVHLQGASSTPTHRFRLNIISLGPGRGAFRDLEQQVVPVHKNALSHWPRLTREDRWYDRNS